MNEEQQMVTTAALAVQANIITRSMALEKLRSVYPFENIEQVMQQLEQQLEKEASPNVEHLLAKALKTEEELDAKQDAETEAEGGNTEAPAGR